MHKTRAMRDRFPRRPGQRRTAEPGLRPNLPGQLSTQDLRRIVAEMVG